MSSIRGIVQDIIQDWVWEHRGEQAECWDIEHCAYACLIGDDVDLIVLVEGLIDHETVTVYKPTDQAFPYILWRLRDLDKAFHNRLGDGPNPVPAI